MKNHVEKSCFQRKVLIKYVRIMKIIIFFLFFLMAQVSAEVTNYQNVTLLFNLKNVTMENAINEIESKTAFKFVFTDKAVDTSRKLSIRISNGGISDVLNQLIQNTDLEYHIVENQIVLSKKNNDVLQENKTISGVVTEKDGEPVIGASVVEKGTTNGVITDVDGKFVLQTSSDAVLVFSYIGYITQEITVGNRTSISVIMEENIKEIEEVVVIGYGTARKRDLTGSVSQIKTEDLAMRAPRNVHDLLRANAAGLNIGFATNAKGEADISIRGNGSLTAGNTPLIVLDNVIYEGALSDINPQDIASIDILKDASAVAVYGAKSVNGVIAITTKRGKTGKPVINIHSNVGWATKASQPRLLDAEGFLRFRQDYNEGRQSDDYLAQYPQIYVNPSKLDGISQLDWYNYTQTTPVTSVTDEQLTTQWLSRLNFTTPEIDNYFAGKVTKWDDLVFQTAFLQDYNVSVSNATDYISQYYSVGYADRQGIVVGDRYTTIRVRANLESKITSFLTVGANAQFATRNEGFLASDWGAMAFCTPYGSNNIDDPDSPYRRSPNGWGGDCPNPFYANLYTDRYDRKNNINANLFARLFLPLGVEYQVNFTPYYHFADYYNHQSSKSESWAGNGGSSTRQTSRRFNWQVDNIVRWKQEFSNIHRVEVTLLANAEKAQYWQTTANAKEYSPNDVLGYHRLQAGTVPTVSSEDTYQTGAALMGRLFYSLQNKYMITASIRRDSYSGFGKQNPHATFPSVALGWAFSQEKFMETTSHWLNYGKLRLTWGVNGNRDIGMYAALSDLVSGSYNYIDQSGNTYTSSQIYANRMANHQLKWERSEAYNIGLDFALFNDILSGSAEIYFAETNDLLVNRALPNLTGFSNVTSNLGKVGNKGFELTLNAKIMNRNDFQWNASATFSMNRRKIKTLYGDMEDIVDGQGNVVGQKEVDDPDNGWFIGQDPDRIWAYERTGVWQLDEATEAARYGCQPGDFKYKDQNEDGVMDRKDNVFQGYKTPRFRWSMQHDFNYKGFNLSLMFYSYWKYYNSFNRTANNSDGFPDRTSSYDFPRWTSTNPINGYARIGSKNIGTNWIDRSFIRLEHVTLSYDLPKKMAQQFSVQGLRFSIGVQNAGVWSPHWNFWDPENGSLSQRLLNLSLNLIL
jgi:TonB-linked SusC/RagA family outer membrane protein